jgi:hypothetical protein
LFVPIAEAKKHVLLCSSHRQIVQEQSVKELQEEHVVNPDQVYKEAIDVRPPHTNGSGGNVWNVN